jgi:hypothetical protein
MGAALLLERLVSKNPWWCDSHSTAHPHFIAPGDTSIGFLFCAIRPIEFGFYLTDASYVFGQKIFLAPVAMSGILKK